MWETMDIDICRIVDLPKITDPGGNLTFIEGGNHIPFNIQRAGPDPHRLAG